MRVKLSIGDWSQDGHNQYEEFVYESNKSVEEIQEAYKASCALTGLQFNYIQDKENYTGLNLNWQDSDYDDRQIAVEYESSHISKLAEEILKSHGIDVWEGYDPQVYDFKAEKCPIQDEENFIDLWLQFVKLSLPDLKLEEASFKKSELKTLPAINGWWNENLNVQFGYGLYE